MANFWGYFEKPHSYVKTAVATYAVTFGNIWPFLLQYLVTLIGIRNFAPFKTSAFGIPSSLKLRNILTNQNGVSLSYIHLVDELFQLR